MDMLNILYRIPMPRSIRSMFEKALADCETVLDAGCGSESILIRLGLDHNQITGLDIWGEYAKRHLNDKRYKGYYYGDVTEATFPAKSFDAVVLSDVIEHIPREQISESGLFDKINSWAKKKVIIMVPYGYVSNEFHMRNGNPYMRHESGWTSGELRELGFNVRSTYRVRRRKYWGIMGLEFVRTIFAVKEVNNDLG